MKKKKVAIVTVFILVLSMMLTGCGVVDDLHFVAHKIAVAITNGEIEDNIDDDDDDDDNGRYGSGGSYSQVAAAPLEDQYRVLIANQTKWFVGNRSNDRFSAEYGVTDLDNDGFIEIVRVMDSYYDYSSESLVLEVNDDCDGLNEIKIEYDGHSIPDIGSLYSAYMYKNNVYFSNYSYIYNSTDGGSYMDYYLIYMIDDVITCELIKYEYMDYDTYETKYYDAKGKEIDENQYYLLDEGDIINYGEYVSRYICMQDCMEISRPYGEVTDTDLYYFLEHGYAVFMNDDLRMGTYYGELTVYTDPDSADYKALEDVVVLNPGATGTPVRFTSSMDATFDIREIYWSKDLECPVRNGYVWDEMYFNRAYELILDLDNDDGKIQVVSYGNASIPINEENFGKQNGTYTLCANEVGGKEIDENDRFVKALGIVAYEVYKANSSRVFADDEETYYKTLAELISYIYGLEDGDAIAVPEIYVMMICESFFEWDWDCNYWKPSQNFDFLEYHDGYDDDDDECEIRTDRYIEDYYGDYPIEHYVVNYVDYKEAFEAINNVSIDVDTIGEYYSIEYTFAGTNGNPDTVVEFDIVFSAENAFQFYASYIEY